MKRIVLMLAGACAVTAMTTPAFAQDHWDQGGGRPGDHGPYELRGRGVPMLAPELRDTPRGRAFVIRNFDANGDGFISPREADAANRAFDRMRHGDRGRFDRDDADRAPPPPPAPPAAAIGRPMPWSHQGMRAYHFHQNRYGAMMSLSDVLFQTGSAELRPHAADKLQDLAGYLRDNPRVKLRIDGFTDSVGSAASNIALSHARADSVAHALAEMGVRPDRMALYGHGEADPVASNTSASGRQLNRRVEVTLIGQRAAAFE